MNDLDFGILLQASRPDPTAKVGDAMRSLLAVPANTQHQLLLSIKPFAVGAGIRIMALGATHRDWTTYEYVADGKTFTSLNPLGSYQNPLYTLPTFGGFLRVQRAFDIYVSNNDTLTNNGVGDHDHSYAARVVYANYRNG